jgi:diguanylate cyclase (GGDEF)-like protein
MALHQDVLGSGEQARVLLIEDDPGTAMLIGAMLRAAWGEGLVLVHAERFSDATQELLDRGASCVLLELAVDDDKPLDRLDQLRNAAPEVALVALTDRADEALALDAIRVGAQDCLVKADLNPARLRRAVSHAIERKRSEVRLAHQALHDPLTALPNRALFLDRLGVALDRSRRTSASVAVLFLDVDNFKEINDSMGHAAGDKVLASLGERLRTMLRPMDTVARFGGDEFTLLFEDLASEREVVLIADRISRTAANPIVLDGGEASITVSIGIAMVSDPAIPAETVIREADVAMYRAKELGRSRYELFDEASRQRATDRLELEAELRRALERSELRVHYQPEVSLDASGGVVGFEALVRWEHPQRGLIAPREFIPLAEETGIVVAIGQFVLEQALHQIASWRRSRPRLTMSVNLSARQLEDTGLSSMLASAIDAAGSSPDALCLEITETTVARNPEAMIRALNGLKAVGVTIAIDDYGTGSSLLSSLRRLPIDVLKIHESFVRGLGTDPGETTIVGAVVELAHALGLGVVAEGVETEAQLTQLRELGCDSAQGYLFSPAVPEEEAHALLTRT